MRAHDMQKLEPRVLLSDIDGGFGTNDRLHSADDLGVLYLGTYIYDEGNIGYDADGFIFRNSGDVDLVRFELFSANLVDVDVSNLTGGAYFGFARVRLFDARGYELARWLGTGRPERLDLDAGVYFLGISGNGNSFYDPRNGQSTFLGDSGNYSIIIETGSQPGPRNASEFIDWYDRYGFVGDQAAEALLAVAPGAWYGRADWGAENYWFQDEYGDVWSLWHGGDVHRRAFGEYDWQLDNLTAAAGYSGQLYIEPGSLSAVVTGWRAFSVQVVIGGDLAALWWSPESSDGYYIDEYGYEKLGLGLGRLGNGWVLESISGAWVDTNLWRVDLGPIRPYTDSQPNGRASFYPDQADAWNDGFSIVIVLANGEPWVASFSLTQGVWGASWLNQRWVVEPLWASPAAASMSFADLDFWEVEFDLRSRD